MNIRMTAAALVLAASAAQAGQVSVLRFQCDLNGAPAAMVMQIEAVGASGVTYGSGPNAGITGVIPTGDYTLYTAGEVRSQAAYYTFSGQNQYADVIDQTYNQRFRVMWVEDAARGGIWMIINPHGQGPAQHFCRRTGQADGFSPRPSRAG